MKKTKTLQIDKAKQQVKIFNCIFITWILDDYFLLQDVCRSLAFLRKNDRFKDFSFVCGPEKNLVHGHMEIFKQASPLLDKLFNIAREKQVSLIFYVKSQATK